jgi:hypothetical protein
MDQVLIIFLLAVAFMLFLGAGILSLNRFRLNRFIKRNSGTDEGLE